MRRGEAVGGFLRRPPLACYGRQVSLGGALPGVAGQHPPVAGLGEAAPALGAGGEGVEAGGDLLGVGGVHQDAVLLVALAHRLARAAVLGDDGRKSRGHRLQRREAERLVVGRQGEDRALGGQEAVRGGEAALAPDREHRDRPAHPGMLDHLHDPVEDRPLAGVGLPVVLKRVLQVAGDDHQVRALAQRGAARERLDERPVVLFGVEPAGGDDARQFEPLGVEVALQTRLHVGVDGLLVLGAGVFVEDVHRHARGDGGEAGAVGRVHGPAVGVVGVLDKALLARAGDVHRASGSSRGVRPPGAWRSR